ncbi:MAG: DUF3800 domain-containing protein [Candidatus Helarchaeota archaeon]
MSDITHYAYSDESCHTTQHDYGSIAILSFPASIKISLESQILPIVKALPKELKWSNLKNERFYQASIGIFNILFSYAVRGELRVDSIIWQTHDHRYPRNQTNTGEKLSVLYFLRLRDLVSKRWGRDTRWSIYADEQQQIDWDQLSEFLVISESRSFVSTLFGPEYDLNWLRRNHSIFSLEQIQSVKSIHEPFIQVADIFAGAGAYSHNNSKELLQWINTESSQEFENGCNQIAFDFLSNDKKKLSSKHKWHCKFIQYLQDQCKTKSYQVSISEFKGLHTFDPTSPFNFFYAGNEK